MDINLKAIKYGIHYNFYAKIIAIEVQTVKHISRFYKKLDSNLIFCKKLSSWFVRRNGTFVLASDKLFLNLFLQLIQVYVSVL